MTLSRRGVFGVAGALGAVAATPSSAAPESVIKKTGFSFEQKPLPPSHIPLAELSTLPIGDPLRKFINSSPLGPLALLVDQRPSGASCDGLNPTGTWSGHGFNVIWRPNGYYKKLSNLAGGQFLQLMFTKETLRFVDVTGCGIVNRGPGNWQDDIRLGRYNILSRYGIVMTIRANTMKQGSGVLFLIPQAHCHILLSFEWDLSLTGQP